MSLGRLAGHLPLRWAAWGPFLAGAGAYLLFHLFFPRPIGLYVFGHELSHAAAAFLSGYRVKSLFVSGKGGEVQLSDSNVFVALAPYVVPFYTVLWAGLYFFADRYAAFSAPPFWAGAGVGATLCFHLLLTLHALGQNQPDLRHAGVFFSMTVIVLCNTLVLVGVLKILFPETVSWTVYFRGLWSDTRGLAGQGMALVRAAGGWGRT